MSKVEWKKLGEISEITIGEFVHKDKQNPKAKYPVYNGGIAPTGFYDNYNNNENKIVISARGATAGFVNKVLCKYWAGNSSYSIDINPLLSSWLFVFYFLKNCQNRLISDQQKGGGIPAISKKQVQDILIPVPSLSEQNRIVGILDTFTASIDNLKEQIALRRKQYEYYRDQLLDLEGKDGIEIKSLKEIVKSYCTGATPKKGTAEFYDGGTVPWLRTQDVRFNEIYTIDSYVTNEAVEKTGIKWIPANCVIIAISGATAGRCAINKIPTTTNQHCLNLEINPKKALYKYVYYCVYNAYDKMISKKQGVRGDLNSSIILGIKIPVPSIEQQSRIVSILDTFEESIQNLEDQLSQREKQYEYYRNKLLTFE